MDFNKMPEQLKIANELNLLIYELSDFIKFLKEGDSVSRYNKKDLNKFFEIKISARIWTGSDNPSYSKILTNSYIISEIKYAILGLLEKKLEDKKIELINLFK